MLKQNCDSRSNMSSSINGILNLKLKLFISLKYEGVFFIIFKEVRKKKFTEKMFFESDKFIKQ